MNLVDMMTDYLRGEKLEALVFILPLGLASIVFGAWLLTDAKESFFRGVAWPFVVLGLALTVTGATVGFRTPAQVERLSAAYVAEPEKTRTEEQARMAKVNQAWPVYLTAWATFAVVGLVLRFALKNEFGRGIGTALVFFAGVGLLIDGFAERRAHPYTKALESAGPKPSAEPH
ncbi:MAG TPA: hypothetical protein PKA58_06785 [Polyangium sp.]|jgi:hypothetical protein|nr:hypothetical protein [Polyangium sp.]